MARSSRCGAGLAHHVRFEHGAHFDELDDLVQAQAGHDGLVVRDDAHEPFGLELPQRFAYGHARDVEVLRELDLIELFAIGELAVVNGGAQGGSDVIGSGLAFAQSGVPLEPLEFVGGDLPASSSTSGSFAIASTASSRRWTSAFSKPKRCSRTASISSSTS